MQILEANELLDLLFKIDGGYKPTTKERISLSSLRVLDLSGVGITELPESIGELKELKLLNLSNNELSVLPVSIETSLN